MMTKGSIYASRAGHLRDLAWRARNKGQTADADRYDALAIEQDRLYKMQLQRETKKIQATHNFRFRS